MSTDRELLEAAAKAAGCVIHATHQAARDAAGSGDAGLWLVDVGTCWNPLTDDGDAFRLMCAKSLRIVEERGGAYRAVQFTVCAEADFEAVHEIEIEWPHTPAATRRAVVRAAATIGAQA